MSDFNKTYASTNEKVLDLVIEIQRIIREYYEKHPKEKGRTNTEFYKFESSVLDTLERCVEDLRYKLKNPDTIQGYDTK